MDVIRNIGLDLRINVIADEDNRFMRQLRRQFPDDWPLLSDFEREDRRQELFHVVVTKLVDLLARVEKSEENEVEGAQRVHNEQDGTAIQMNAELLNCLVGVWKNESVQAAWEQCRGEPEFEDLAYFMNNADRVLQHDSVVSIEDWGHVNLQSTGVDSHKCSLRVHSIWEIHDSSRLGCNTKKWQHMFANAKELFYVVPINEYDQGSLGDPGVNAIRSDMDEFANIVNGEFNHDKGIFLIFTNYTMFCEKLRTIPIKVLDSSHPERNRWTDYTGIESMAEATVDAREVADQGIEYFKRKFVERVEGRNYRGKSFSCLQSITHVVLQKYLVSYWTFRMVPCSAK